MRRVRRGKLSPKRNDSELRKGRTGERRPNPPKGSLCGRIGKGGKGGRAELDIRAPSRESNQQQPRVHDIDIKESDQRGKEFRPSGRRNEVGN